MSPSDPIFQYSTNSWNSSRFFVFSSLETDVARGHYDRRVSTGTFIVTSLLALFTLTLYYIVSMRNVSSKSNRTFFSALTDTLKSVIPGNLPLIGPLHMVAWHGKDFLKCLSYWAHTYGPIFQTTIFGKKFAIINDVQMMQKLYTSNHPGHLSKSTFIYEKLYTGKFLDGLITAPVTVWKPHREILAKAFTYESFKKYLSVLNFHAAGFVSELNFNCTDGNEAKSQFGELTFKSTYSHEEGKKSFVELVHLYTLRIISHIAVGSDVINDTEGLTFHKNTNRFKEIIGSYMFNLFLHIPFVWRLHPNYKEINKITEDGFLFVENLMNKRCQENAIFTKSQTASNDDSYNEDKSESDSTYVNHRFKSTLDILLEAKLPENEVLTEVATFITAGHETVSMALTFLIFHLALHPEHQSICREEADKAFDDLVSQKPLLTMDSLNELKHLERCIKETLRMWPTVAGLPRELGTPIKLNETTELQVGTVILGSIWAVHRNPTYYPNPDKFEPDRFLPENSKQRSVYTFMPFSAGPRNCIGWKLAMIEMKLLSAWILRHFEVYTTDKLSDIKLVPKITLDTSKPLNIGLKRRDLTVNTH